VDFPDPDWPTTKTNSPRSTSSETSSRAGRVVRGHAILQPRVTPSLPTGDEGSLYQRVFSGPTGLDPYAVVVSDIYQDLYDEGSYVGKGIYDVDAFERATAGRFPENTVLSHDLIESVHARSALLQNTRCEGFDSFTRMAMRFAPGTASWKISINLASTASSWLVTPVMFPPGLARLATNLLSTAFATFAMTIGIVWVAFCAA